MLFKKKIKRMETPQKWSFVIENKIISNPFSNTSNNVLKLSWSILENSIYFELLCIFYLQALKLVSRFNLIPNSIIVKYSIPKMLSQLSIIIITMNTWKSRKKKNDAWKHSNFGHTQIALVTRTTRIKFTN